MKHLTLMPYIVMTKAPGRSIYQVQTIDEINKTVSDIFLINEELVKGVARPSFI